MQYLLINPIPQKNTGIDNYSNYLKQQLNQDVIILSNDKKLTPVKFREYVHDFVIKNYGVSEVIIEAPEAKASTLLLPKEYKVHIRLHCPLSVAQKYDGFSINQNVYSEELRVINKAWKVSSPSYGLLEEMADEINTDNISVFPNFPPVERGTNTKKEYDLLFIGRFQKLKGIESLNPVLELLSSNKKVALAGPGAKQFSLSKDIECQVDVIDYVEGKEKDELYKKSKYVFLASEFENCSMVALEAIAFGAQLIAWNVGGNAELYHPELTFIVEKNDYQKVAGIINGEGAKSVDYAVFNAHVDTISNTAMTGYLSILNQEKAPYKKDLISTPILNEDISHITVGDLRSKRLKVFGFSVSNEHLEEMWMPAIKSLNIDYYFVCRRPLGFHSKFEQKYDIESNKFKQYDWIKFPHRLLGELVREKPDFILFHNGLHPMYSNVISMIKKIGIPVIYTELGWFPQQNNVYFDSIGVNAFSKLAQDNSGIENDVTAMCGEIKKKNTLLCLQLENDTNIIVSSKRFKKNLSLIKYVHEQLENERIVVRPHPDDKNIESYKKFINKLGNVSVCKENSFEGSVKNAKAVIALNSTVLLNSLYFDVNIYALGDGLSNNKLGVIDCSNKELKDCWLEYDLLGKESRKKTIDFFCEHQFYVGKSKSKSKNEDVLPTSLHSFARIYQSSERRELYSRKTQILKNEYLKSNPHFIILKKDNKDEKPLEFTHNKATEKLLELKLNKVTEKSNNKSIRKLKKLIKNPVLYFRDAYEKRSM